MVALQLIRMVARSSGSAAGPALPGRLGSATRLAAVAALLVVALGTAAGTPRPGLEGQGLGVTLALAAVLATGLDLVRVRTRDAAALAASLLVLGFASAALAGLDPNAPGYVGAFIAAGGLALRAARPVAGWCTALIVAAMTIALVVSRSPQTASIVSIDLGIAFAYAMAAFAREQSRLVAELREAQEARAQAAALQERTRLAREIHDVLAHSLTGLSVQLEAARLVLGRGPADPRALAQVERAQALARTGLEETRRAVSALRGDAMPGPELLPALAADFEEASGIPCALDVTGEPVALSSEARLALYRTVQEALTNTRKHAADATGVSIRLTWGGGVADLVVADRSAGRVEARPDALTTTGGGYGLGGVRERAELLGGALEAGPAEGGFRVHLTLPAEVS